MRQSFTATRKFHLLIGTIKSIKLKNVYGAGECVYDPSSTTGKYVWEQTGERKDFVQSFNVEVEGEGTVDYYYANSLPEYLRGTFELGVLNKFNDMS